jgi:hypothetical protein
MHHQHDPWRCISKSAKTAAAAAAIVSIIACPGGPTK